MNKFAKESFFANISYNYCIVLALINMKNIYILLLLVSSIIFTWCFEKDESQAVETSTGAVTQDQITEISDETEEETPVQEDESSPQEDEDALEPSEQETQDETQDDTQEETQESEQPTETSNTWETSQETDSDQESINASIEELQQILTGEDIDKLFE